MIYDLCNGFGVTLKLFALTLLFAIPLGFILAFLSMSKFKPISFVTKFFIWIIRGTPLLLQCLIVTFVPSMIFDIPNKDFKELLGLETMADLQFVFVIGVCTAAPITANAASLNDLTFELNDDGESYSVDFCLTYASGDIVIPDTYTNN